MEYIVGCVCNQYIIYSAKTHSDRVPQIVTDYLGKYAKKEKVN